MNKYIKYLGFTFSVFFLFALFFNFFSQFWLNVDAQYIQDDNEGFYLLDFKVNNSGFMSTAPWTNGIAVNNVVGSATLSTPPTAGSFFTSTITPLSFSSWDKIYIEGNWSNASDVKYRVSNCTGTPPDPLMYVPGFTTFQNFGPGNEVDISSINKTTYPCIRVELSLTQGGSITPVVNTVKVTWKPLPVLLVSHGGPIEKLVGQEICYDVRYSLSYSNDDLVTVFASIPDQASGTVLYPGAYPTPGSAVNPTSAYGQNANPSFSSATENGIYTSVAIVGNGTNGIPTGMTIPAKSVYWKLGTLPAGTTGTVNYCIQTQNGWQNNITYYTQAGVVSERANVVYSDSSPATTPVSLVSLLDKVKVVLKSTPSPSLDKTVSGTVLTPTFGINSSTDGGKVVVPALGGYTPVVTYHIKVANCPLSNGECSVSTASEGVESIFQPQIDDVLVGTPVSDVITKLTSAACGSLSLATAQSRIQNISSGGALNTTTNTILWDTTDLGGTMGPRSIKEVSFNVDYTGCISNTDIWNKAIFSSPNISTLEDSLKVTTGVTTSPAGVFAKGDKIFGVQSITALTDDNPFELQPHGDNYSYLLTTENTGAVTLNNVVMIDKIPTTSTLTPNTEGVPSFLSASIDPLLNATILYYTNGAGFGNPANTPPDYVSGTFGGGWSNVAPSNPSTVTWVAFVVPCISSQYFSSPEGTACNPNGGNNNTPFTAIGEIQVKLNNPTVTNQCRTYDVPNTGMFYAYSASPDLSNSTSSLLTTPLTLEDNFEPVHIEPPLARLNNEISLSGPSEATVGDIVTYNFKVKNTGVDTSLNTIQTINIPSVSVNGVLKFLPLENIIPPAGAVVDYSQVSTGIVRINYGNVAAGVEKNTQISFSIPRGINSEETFVITTTLLGADNNVCAPITATTSAATKMLGLPKLQVYKTRDEALIPSGGTIHYQLNYQHTLESQVPSTQTWVVDRIPEKSTFLKAYTSGTDTNGTSYTCVGCKVYFSQKSADLPPDSTPIAPFIPSTITDNFTIGTESPTGVWSSPFGSNTYYIAWLVDNQALNPDMFPVNSIGKVGFEVINDDDGIGGSTSGSPAGTFITNYSAILSAELLQAIGNQVITTILPSPGLNINKVSSKDFVYAGETFQWNIDYYNDSASNDTLVKIIDTLPAGITLSSVDHTWNTKATSDGAPIASTGNITNNSNVQIINNPDGTTTIKVNVTGVNATNDPSWPTVGGGLRAGDLTLLEGGRITLNVIASPTLQTNSILENAVTGQFENNTGAFTIYDYDSVQIANTDLSINKFVDILDPVSGQTITYTLIIKNLGLHDAEGVIINDILPAGLCFVTGSTNVITQNWTIGTPTVSGACGSIQTITWNNLDKNGASLPVAGTLPANDDDITITYKATVGAGVISGTLLQNDATVTNNIPEDTLTNNNSSQNVTTPYSDPYVRKSSRATVSSGGVFDYQILYGNNTAENATNFYLIDSLPTGSSKVTLQSVIVTHGETVCYSNQASAPSFVSGGTCSQSGWTSTLLPDATFIAIDKGSLAGLEGPNEVKITVKATNPTTSTNILPGTDLTNNVLLSITNGEEDASTLTDNQSSSTTRVPGFDLTIDKTGSSEGTYPGIAVSDELSYTITVQNTGDTQVCGVKISDTIPSDLELSSPSNNFSTLLLKDIDSGATILPTDTSGTKINSTIPITLNISGNNMEWLVGNTTGPLVYTSVCMPKKSYFTFQVFTKVKDTTPDSTNISNQIVVSEDGPGNEEVIINNTSSSSVVAYKADVITRKSGVSCGPDNNCNTTADNSEQFTNAGELIRYTVDYNNTGNTDAQNVILTENIPSTTCFTKSSITGLPAGVTIQYSNDGGTTWTYTPTAGAGEDCNITNFRLVWSQAMPAPANYSGEAYNDFGGLFSSTSVTSDLDNVSLSLTASSQSYSIGGNTREIAIGDFNADGYQDVAYANTLTTANDENICYGSSTDLGNCNTILTGGETDAIAAGDFNNDGYDDIYLTQAGTVPQDDTYCLGSASGILIGACTTLVGTAGFPTVNGTFSKDFNNDGFDDVLVINSASQQNKFCQGSAGGLTCTNVNSNISNPRSVTIGDFNGDGFYDFVTGDAGNASADGSQCLGTAAGFVGVTCSVITGTAGTTSMTKTVNVNNDLYDDVVFFNWLSIASNYCLGSATGINSATCTNIPNSASTTGYGVSGETGDFNNDGYADIILGSFFSAQNLFACQGNPTGFDACATLGIASSGGITDIAVADFNGDGIDDFITARQGTKQLCLGKTGTSIFGLQCFSILSSGSTNNDVKAVDYNGDGIDDYAFALWNSPVSNDYFGKIQYLSTGLYRRTFTPNTTVISWDKFSAISDVPLGTVLRYTICSTGQSTTYGICPGGASTVIYSGTLPDGNIDLSSFTPIPTSIHATAYFTSSTNNLLSPLLDAWRVTWIGPTPSFTFTVRTKTSGTFIGTTVDNNVSISTTTPELASDNNTGEDHLNIINSDLEIKKSVDKAAANYSENLTYTLHYCNNGPSRVSLPTITDVLPVGMTFVSAVGTPTTSTSTFTTDIPTCSNAAGIVTCNFSTSAGDRLLSVNECGDINIIATLPASGVVSYDNTSGITSTVQDNDLSNNNDNALTVIGNYPNVWVQKTGGGIAEIGKNVTYYLDYGNNGNLAATSVVLTDNLNLGTSPAYSGGAVLTYISATQEPGFTGPAFTCSHSGSNPGGLVTCNIGTLNPGEKGKVKITATLLDNNSLLTIPPSTLLNSTNISTSTPNEVSINDNADNYNVPIIMSGLSSISGHVFVDQNSDLIFNSGNDSLGVNHPDKYIEGVEITLTGTDIFGEPVLLTTTTDSSGYYAFSALNPGVYTVTETQPNEYLSVGSIAGTNLVPSSNNGTGQITPAGAGNIISNINLGQEDDSVFNDFGEKLGEIGNYVWIDMGVGGVGTGDGIFNAGETPLQGVQITLYNDTNHNYVYDTGDISIAVTSTDANGYYLFTQLLLDDNDPTTLGYDYIVRVTERTDTNPLSPNVLQGYVQTPTVFLPSNTTDQIARSDLSYPVTLTINDISEYTADFAYVYGRIGNQLYEDINGNRQFDLGTDIPLSNVQVNLLDSSGNPILDTFSNPITALTDTLGQYYFNNLNLDDGSGSYTYKVSVSNSTVLAINSSYVNLQGTGNLDNIGKDPTGYNITLSATAPVDLTGDFGYIIPVSLGDFVWHDIDRDGIQDVTETGIAGATVHLSDALGNPVNDASGNPVTDIITTATGAYLFTNLVPGDYIVTFTAPTGYNLTLADQGTDDTVDSDASVVDGKTTTITLVSGVDQLTWDAGVYKPVSLGDFVWHDIDRDGIQDVTETGIAGATVHLSDALGNPVNDASGNPVTDIITTATGAYLFTNLVPGNYIVTFTAPTGYNLTLADQGTDDTVDSDASVIDGKTTTITLVSGVDQLTWDAGVYKPVSLGDFVWHDIDRDGIQDVSEIGIAGATVHLSDALGNPVNDADGNPVTDIITTATGAYLFTNLVPGNYIVTFTAPTGYNLTLADQGTDDTVDSDASVVDGKTTTITLVSGVDQLTWDAGVYKPVSLGDFVWHDIDRDGIQDVTEIGIAGATVHLSDALGNPVNDASGNPVTDIITTATGSYLFTNLVPGNYIVTFTAPTGYNLTLADQGTDDTVDSDASVVDGKTTSITLVSGVDQLTWDAGVYKPVSLGDFVWHDIDRDGIQDVTEIGIAGATVHLSDTLGNPVNDADGNPVTDIITTATGSYLFTNLVPGNYIVTFTAPTGYNLTLADQGTDDTVDSDASVVDGKTTTITLVSGVDQLTWDAGVYKPVSLGDFVWHDIDRDGIQDVTEIGIAGATVHLSDALGNPVNDADGNPVTDIITTATGSYLFTNLVPGNYIVTFTAPSGYNLTLADQGVDTTDSDASVVDGKTTTITLVSGVDQLTWDAGVYKPVSLGDFVWHDIDRDGIQDVTETGIAGATVHLSDALGNPVNDASGNPVTDIITTATGSYLFTNLVPGNYIVTFTAPTGYNLTLADQGTDDTVDSDASVVDGKTTTITLVSGVDQLTWDAGVYKPVSLGDFVWHDENRNGIQDLTESGIAGATVHLSDTLGNPVNDASGNPVTDIITTATGSYLFTNLVPGNYIVTFTAPTGYNLTLADQGVDTTDSDASVVDGKTTTITLVSGVDQLTWDAGVYKPVSLGDFVWEDLDRDGIQDVTETGIAGATVHLSDALGNPVNDADGNPVTDIITTATGAYLFTNLVPGDYIVTFTAPTGYNLTLADQGTDDIVDSDASVVDGKTTTITLVSGVDQLTWDAGVYKPVSLGDFVWHDIDRDGIQDVTEIGIAGATVHLSDALGNPVNDADGNPVTDIITTATGSYLFTNLVPGDYIVTFTAPTGYNLTLADQGTDDTVDSDASVVDGKTTTITLVSGVDQLTWDAGVYMPVSLGDFVWHDIDRDGIQDVTETGIAGATVHLSDALGNPVNDASGNPVTDIITTATGAYLFTNLVPGNYIVTFTAPTGYNLTLADQGVDTTDSDASVVDGKTTTITLVSGVDQLTWDAGVYMPVSLGDFVWHDIDRDGIQDVTEIGIAGATVHLSDALGNPVNDASGNPVTDIITTATGAYLFTNLVPGDYIVTFTAPTGYNLTLADQGTDDTVDSDASVVDGKTTTITLVSGVDQLTWDAGVYKPVSLGDFVWEDLDRDGIQDVTETGIAGATVHLSDALGNPVNDADGNPVTDIITTATGAYLFTNLVPGNYIVTFTAPTGYNLTLADQGTDDTVDSDASVVDGKTTTITLVSGVDQLTWDAGVYKPVSLGDFVWHDIDRDGIQDVTEIGIAGATVHLSDALGNPVNDASGNPVTDIITTATGSYLFTNLVPGNYIVTFTAPTGYNLTLADQGTDDTVDSDASVVDGKTTSITLVSGVDQLTWDAGVYKPVSLGDFVWHDIDRDGIQDVSEIGIAGATVHLSDALGNPVNDADGNPVTDIITTATGAYLFTNLVPGDYIVTFTAPTGYNLTLADQGTDDTVDSDASVVDGKTTTITLVSGVDQLTWDAGVYMPVSLGDFVWHDENRNGIQDVTESGIAGATVHLSDALGNPVNDADGNPVTDIITTATGSYLFTNLVPGNYIVTFTAPTGYNLTLADQGVDTTDSDASVVDGKTTTITLVSGVDQLTWDAGVYKPVSLGDFVWEDLDRDGIQDVTETGIAGATVHLSDTLGNPVNDASGNPVTDIITTATGSYLFTNLVPGNYIVTFTAPTGYNLTLADQGVDTTDSDASVVDGKTTTITLVSGVDQLTWDAGVYKPVSLGDFVWHDENRNGIQDVTETGIAGATVHLSDALGNPVNDADGNPVTDIITTATGSYLFTNLVPGDYIVTFTAPTGYNLTLADQGADDTVDSDASVVDGKTTTITLVSGVDQLTWDAGVYKPVSLGDFVWHDIDRDGIQDVTEIGIAGATVHLSDALGNPVNDASGNPVTDIITTATGAYLFTNLVPGDYIVTFTAPTGYNLTLADQGVDTTDSDASVVDGKTTTITLVSGVDQLTWDAGVYKPVSLGDFVWHDIDRDGIQDVTEIGIAGATVHLSDALGNPVNDADGNPVTDIITTATGSYLFTNLVPGNYIVTFTAPTGYNLTLADQGTDDTVDSDASVVDGKTTTITLVSGVDQLTWDAGVYKPVSLGDFVWEDLDRDGIQDVTESGIAGATVHLSDALGNPVNDADGNPVTDIITTATGSYLFTNLVPGDYIVTFTAPTGYNLTLADQGTDDTVDSDASVVDGKTTTITLVSGVDQLTWDAGVYMPASLGDLVWNDINQNGLQDNNEVGISGVSVSLVDVNGENVYDANNILVENQFTDTNGKYLFTNLLPGEYKVIFSEIPLNYVISTQNVGSDDSIDSDADTVTGQTSIYTLQSGDNILTVDLGIYIPVASIGNYVWVDSNLNGIQDTNEVGIAGVIVELIDTLTNEIINTTVTDTNGLYIFKDLIPSQNYTVKFTVPEGYLATIPNAGTDQNDSNKQITKDIILSDNEYNDTIDFGIFKKVQITGIVGIDTNNNGVIDPSETVIPGTTVEILDKNGNVIATAVTDANGTYVIKDLPNSLTEYKIRLTLPNGYTFVDTNSNIFTSPTLSLTGGENSPTYGQIKKLAGKLDNTGGTYAISLIGLILMILSYRLFIKSKKYYK